MHFTVTEKRLPIGRPFARLRMNRRAPTILGMFILSLMTVSSLDGQPAREPFYEMRPARRAWDENGQPRSSCP